jgi:hypothetical protein
VHVPLLPARVAQEVADAVNHKHPIATYLPTFHHLIYCPVLSNTHEDTLAMTDPPNNTLYRVCIEGSPTMGNSMGRSLTDSDDLRIEQSTIS